MSQAPRSQNEITNVVTKFPNLVAWVEELQKKIKIIEKSASTVVNEVKEQIETVSLEDFSKFKTDVSISISNLESSKSDTKELSALKKELDALVEKVKNLEASTKKEVTKTKTSVNTENTPKQGV